MMIEEKTFDPFAKAPEPGSGLVHQNGVPQQPLQQPSTELAKVDVKAVALSRFGSWRAGAAALVAKYKGVAFDVSTGKGYDEAKRALAEVRAPRYAAQNVAKDSKAELAAVSRAVGEEVEAITTFLNPIEEHIKAQIDAEDKRKADAKAERDRIEAERKAKHQENLTKFKSYLIAAVGRDSVALAKAVAAIEARPIGDDWEEFKGAAELVRTEVLTGLKQMLHDTIAREAQERAAIELKAENERLAAEAAAVRAELEGLRAAAAEERAAAAREAQEQAEKDAELTKAQQAETAFTAPAALIVDPATGEILDQLPPQTTPKAVQAQTFGRAKRSPKPASFSPEEQRLIDATDMALKFGAGLSERDVILSPNQLADLIDHIRFTTKEALQ
jgi:hypothetical protein